MNDNVHKALEQIAFGSDPSTEVLNKYTINAPKDPKKLFNLRREVRRIVLRARPHIVKQNKKIEDFPFEHQVVLRQLEHQFNSAPNITWKAFTFLWDIHPTKPLQLVLKSNWVDSGGGFDYAFMNKGDNQVLYQPTAFTQQDI